MKKLVVILFSIIICTSCRFNSKSTVMGKDDTIKSKQSILIPVKDTTIEYSIEGISAEGSSAKARYIEGEISQCVIDIFGEKGQTKILYVFQDGRINVVEKKYIYKADILSVKSEKDMKLSKEINYVLDENGNPLGNFDNDRTDIFIEFKKVVPLEIK